MEDGLKYMFLMFELMAMTFVILFSITDATKREMELVELEYEIQQLRESIRNSDDQLEYLEIIRKALEDSEK
jgi:hypothetical protein